MIPWLRALTIVGLSLLLARHDTAAFDPAEQDDSQALLRHFQRAPVKPVTPFANGRFEAAGSGTISMIGGREMEASAEAGYFEAMLQQAYGGQSLRVRNLAWSADTVYRQQRPMFFYTAQGDSREGSIPDQRIKVPAGTLMLMFGKMESLDGEGALPAFESAYDALLNELEKLTPRIVLFSPPPFFATGPAADLSASRNSTLAKYANVTRELAQRHRAVFVDLAAGMDPARTDMSRDGVHLSDAGQREAARLLAEGLGIASANGGISDAQLVDLVREKNRLWHQYFRPSNWAFLFGDRQHVPSSRDHIDAKRRWFVEEIQRLPALIAEADEEIWRKAAP